MNHHPLLVPNVVLPDDAPLPREEPAVATTKTEDRSDTGIDARPGIQDDNDNEEEEEDDGKYYEDYVLGDGYEDDCDDFEFKQNYGYKNAATECGSNNHNSTSLKQDARSKSNYAFWEANCNALWNYKKEHDTY